MNLGQNVTLESLPSKGRTYPEDLEIFVKPLSIKEQMDMSRFGITEAEYFRVLLNGITCVSESNFPKKSLYLHDVQFLDLVRRLFTFDVEQEIQVPNVVCGECGKEFTGKFMFHELEFTDFTDESFNQEYEFSDGLTIQAEPITIGRFMEAGRKYFSSKKFDVADIYLGYLSLCVSEVVDREFKNVEAMQDFLYEYFGNLYMAKDKKVLGELEKNSVSLVKPFKLTCPNCGEIVEVVVDPTTQFRQE